MAFKEQRTITSSCQSISFGKIELGRSERRTSRFHIIVPDQERTLSQVGTNSYMAYAM